MHFSRSIVQLHAAHLLLNYCYLQNEWDELTLETFTLKQQLDATRQELSQALYQHDAACRVIAKLMRERDEARAMLSNLSPQGVAVGGPPEVSGAGDGGGAGAMEEGDGGGVPAEGLSEEVVGVIVNTCAELSKGRKGRKSPPGLLSREEVGAFAGGGEASHTSTFTPHDTSKQGVTCLSTPRLSAVCEVVLTGGVDKKAVLSEVTGGRTLAKLQGHSKKINCCDLLGGSLAALPVAVTGSADHLVKVKYRSSRQCFL